MSDMTVGKAAGCWIYFTAHDKPEPTHVHSNKPKKVEHGAAKIWVKRDGETEIDTWGNLTIKEMKAVRKYLKDYHMILFEMWEEKFGELKIYGEPDRAFTVIVEKNGDKVLKEQFNETNFEESNRIELFKQKYDIDIVPPAFEKSIISLPKNVWIEQEPLFADMIKQQVTSDLPKITFFNNP
ncbi:MAG: DUF4160 domain-containing protein [Firmicutes bacterium]|nr:DUF4160 domain-containing protein [Bacillota bacterium]